MRELILINSRFLKELLSNVTNETSKMNDCESKSRPHLFYKKYNFFLYRNISFRPSKSRNANLNYIKFWIKKFYEKNSMAMCKQ